MTDRTLFELIRQERESRDPGVRLEKMVRAAYQELERQEIGAVDVTDLRTSQPYSAVLVYSALDLHRVIEAVIAEEYKC